jgi:hypothetical protein
MSLLLPVWPASQCIAAPGSWTPASTALRFAGAPALESANDGDSGGDCQSEWDSRSLQVQYSTGQYSTSCTTWGSKHADVRRNDPLMCGRLSCCGMVSLQHNGASAWPALLSEPLDPLAACPVKVLRPWWFSLASTSIHTCGVFSQSPRTFPEGFLGRHTGDSRAISGSRLETFHCHAPYRAPSPITYKQKTTCPRLLCVAEVFPSHGRLQVQNNGPHRARQIF